MHFACPRHTAAPTCSLTHSRRRAPARARSTAAATAAAAAAEAASGGGAAVEHVLYTGAPHTSPALEALAAGTHDARAPVVLVHGSFHAAWCWADGGVLQELAAGGRRVVAYSLRGQGGSDAPGGVDYAPALEEHTADLAAVVKQVSAECGGAAPVVVGHSFGVSPAPVTVIVVQDPFTVICETIDLCVLPTTMHGIKIELTGIGLTVLAYPFPFPML